MAPVCQRQLTASSPSIGRLAPTAFSTLGIGTALNSTGAASGFFNGIIDEVRIWSVARTAQDIVANMNAQIVSAPNLLGRWGFNDASGTVAIDSSGRGTNGTIVGTNWSWVTGAPFSANVAPDTPIPSGPGNGVTVL